MITPKRILITVPDLSLPGGVSNYYRTIRPYLHDNTEYFTVGNRRGHGCLASLPRLVADVFKFSGELANPEIKLVHLNPSLDVYSLIRDGINLIIAKLFRKDVLVFFRGWNRKCEKSIDIRFRKLFAHVFFKSTAIIVLAKAFKERLLNWGYTGQVFLETTIVDDSIFRATRREKCRQYDGSVTILFLSRLEADKGIYTAINTVEILSAKYKGLHLIIAGDGSERDNVEKYIRQKCLQEHTTLTGWVSNKDKHEVYLDSTIYIFPSYHAEGMPNSVIEAMAYGLPIVTRPVGGIKNFFQHGRMGYCTDSTDSEVFAEYIDRLIGETDAYESISRYNRAHAYRRFRASCVAERLYRIHSYCMERNYRYGEGPFFSDKCSGE